AVTAFVRTLAGVRVDELRAIRAAIDNAADNAQKAEGWLRLNKAADRFAELLADRIDYKMPAQLGISFDVCDPSRSWMAGTQGYMKYLELLPRGPKADEAWWRAHFTGPRCGDFEGSREEYESLIKEYTDFLTRFPNSQFGPQARQRLEEFRK